MMTETEARELSKAHGEYARGAWRMTKAALASLYRAEISAQGTHLLYGGPGSKDELASAVVALRFPAAALNEAIHVLHHQDSDGWSACEHCHPHGGTGCDCKLGRTTA
jgi:hypothetical protein